MATSPAITVSNLRKTFVLPGSKMPTVLGHLVAKAPGKVLTPPLRRITAVEDVSLSITQGEIYGILGRNAAGKTTLLQLIAGILQPDAGTVQVQGRVVPLINLNAGVVRRLTVRDNIRLLCSLYGLSPEQTRSRFEAVVAFAELENYLHATPNQLSKGLLQRLVLSVAMHTEPGIWLLDEVFTAGDAAFRARATERMEELVQDGRTIVMVSHDLQRLQKLCHRVAWMEEGRIVEEGEPGKVIEAYRGLGVSS